MRLTIPASLAPIAGGNRSHTRYTATLIDYQRLTSLPTRYIVAACSATILKRPDSELGTVLPGRNRSAPRRWKSRWKWLPKRPD